MNRKSADCDVIIIGAGPYGLSAAAYLRSAGVEARVFGEPMSFWEHQMPAGMCLRSNWGASHIADPNHALTLDDYCRETGTSISKPIPLRAFVDYGRWYQRKAVPNLEKRRVVSVDCVSGRFKVAIADGEEFTTRRVVVAGGISPFAARPEEFAGVPSDLASHTSEHKDLTKFVGRQVAIIGAGQSALESAALLKESGIQVEVIARTRELNWVGLHPRLHHLGYLSKVLYSTRDVGPAGISRLVSMPHLFRRLPRRFQDRTAYRAIRPAGAGWLRQRIEGVPIRFGRKVVSTEVTASRLLLRLDDGTERLVDHVLLATGFRVDVCKYPFLSTSLSRQLKTMGGFPVLGRGLQSSVPGLHFVGKPGAWSFGPLLGFVSGAEFASTELLRGIGGKNGRN
jgi:cation diffusion facilitator CzcD-associated flavoprotein CzcO